MSRYNSRPQTPAARTAWDAFSKAMCEDPKEIFYGHGSAHGWVWTAEDSGLRIWIFKAVWGKAYCATNPPGSRFDWGHQAGDKIDLMRNAEHCRHYGKKS